MEHEPPKKGQDAVFVTWRVNARPVGDQVVGVERASERRRALLSAASLIGVGAILAAVMWSRAPESVLAWGVLAIPGVGLVALARALGRDAGETPLSDLGEVRRGAGGLVLATGSAPVAIGREAVERQEGRVAMRAQAIRTFGLPRWLVEQSDLVFPLVMMIVGVVSLQLHLLALLLAMLFPPEAAPPAPEPSIEYLTRLLKGDTAGESTGVVAIREHKVTSETKIDSYYLPAGSAGPITEPGGGRRVGKQPRSADPRPGHYLGETKWLTQPTSFICVQTTTC